MNDLKLIKKSPLTAVEKHLSSEITRIYDVLISLTGRVDTLEKAFKQQSVINHTVKSLLGAKEDEK